MTFAFLSQSPREHETTKKLSAILNEKEDGRIFLLTGNFSNGKNDKAAETLLSLIEWAAAGKDRELVVLVGVFQRPDKTWKTGEVAQTLAGLIVQAEDAYKTRNPPPLAVDVTISFYAVKKWHAKAIGLTGKGRRFHDAQSAIFGSTNFSGSALHGENFELDLFMDNGTAVGKELLDGFIRKTGILIKEALKDRQIVGFHELVQKEVTKLGSKCMPSGSMTDTW